MAQPRNIPAWDDYFLALAKQVSTRSKDPHTQVGCVLVGPKPGREVRSLGYNGLPRKMDDFVPERWERPDKYLFVVHAEANAIFNAARNGSQLLGCTLYCTLPPCVDCAKAIIQAGIIRVVVPGDALLQLRDAPFPETAAAQSDWRGSFRVADEMFNETCVELVGI